MSASNDEDILKQLDQVLEQRKYADSGSSYVASLYHKGDNTILKKIAEEAGETIIAAKDKEPNAIIYETADLWFHTLVMLSHNNLSSKDILKELARRFGLSGIEEKNQRNEGGSK